MPGKCLRGAMIEIDLNPVVGSEQAKVRPCIVVQNDISNGRSSTTIVVPVTGAENVRRASPTHVMLPKGEAGLSKDSVALCEQIRTVDERRFRNTLGHVKRDYMDKIGESIKISLSLD